MHSELVMLSVHESCCAVQDSTHALHYTTVVALLQPAPEVYDLFDDVMLLAEGAAFLPLVKMLSSSYP